MLHLLLSRRPGRDEEKKNEERTGAKKKGNFGSQNKKHIFIFLWQAKSQVQKDFSDQSKYLFFLFIFQ